MLHKLWPSIKDGVPKLPFMEKVDFFKANLASKVTMYAVMGVILLAKGVYFSMIYFKWVEIKSIRSSASHSNQSAPVSCRVTTKLISNDICLHIPCIIIHCLDSEMHLQITSIITKWKLNCDEIINSLNLNNGKSIIR